MNCIRLHRVLSLAAFLTLPVVLLCATPLRAGETFAARPSVELVDGQATVAFAVASATDVEVAVVDARSGVVRHLAAGALGSEQAPPAPLSPGLEQRVAWDGLDDDGQLARGGPFGFRVHTGMGVKLDEVAGGNPYAYWTEHSGQGDHAQWRVLPTVMKLPHGRRSFFNQLIAT
jgi:hypothetical protein